MNLGNLLAQEVTQFLEPVLLARVESPSVAAQLAPEQGSNTDRLSEWCDLVADIWWAAKSVAVPGDWIDWLRLIAQFGDLFTRLQAAAAEDAAAEVEELLLALSSYWLRNRAEPAFWTLDALGLLTWRVPEQRGPVIHLRYSLNKTALASLFRDPSAYFSTLLTLNASSGERAHRLRTYLVPRIGRFLRSLRLPVAEDQAGERLIVSIVLDSLSGAIAASVNSQGSLEISVLGPLRYSGNIGSWAVFADLSALGGQLRISRTAPQGASIFVAGAGGTGLSIGGLEFGLSWNSTGTGWNIRAAFKQVSFSLPASGSDSFSSSVSGSARASATANFALTIDSTSGVRISGDGSFGARVPLSISIGPISIRSLTLGASLRAASLVCFGSLEFDGRLGPIAVSLSGIGLQLSLSLEGEAAPNLDVGVRPPTGATIAVSAGPVSGGGVISHDVAAGRYTGALSLRILEVGINAVGVVDTRAPGVSGYSFLIIISAEFTPIQIGFGFTLNGVGGLCGINRAIRVEALQQSVRDGSLAPMLFVSDPLAQANRIVTATSAIFPPTQDSFVFGPLFKLGWGTPTLVTITIGLVIQLPSPIVIALIGQVEVRLPKPEAAVVEINLDILGLLLPDEKRLSIDASLRNSKVAGWTLTGDMSFRLGWGSKPSFLFSVGGFNPHFEPPAEFPQLRRLALALGTGSNPRISLAAYFAITSNSLQFGARAELYAEAAGFSVHGYLEFHALFIFSPFSFRFDFAAGVSLKFNSTVLAAVSVEGMIAGPRPWRVRGRASITLLFFDVTVSFDETFGSPPEREQIAAVDVWGRLLPALEDIRNWSAELPTGTSRGVSTAAASETPPQVRLDPFSTIAVRQKVIPLDRRISKLGEAPIGGAATFRIRTVRPGTAANIAPIPVSAVAEAFAASQYEPLDDAQRISRPSYEPMTAGVEAVSSGARAAGAVPVTYEWSTVYMASGGGRPGSVAADMMAFLAACSASGSENLSMAGLDRYAPLATAPSAVSLAPERWTVASTTDLRARRDVDPTAAYGEADAAIPDGDAATEADWQVVPAWEVRS